MNYNEAKTMFNTTRKRKLAGNTWLVKTETGYGIKLYDTIVVEYLDEHRIRLNTGGWRTVTTYARMRKLGGVNIYKAGFQSWRAIPDNTVIDMRDFFIEYPNNVTKVQPKRPAPKPNNTFEYTLMGKDFKPIKSIQVDKAKLSSECWLIQFNGPSACSRCEYKGKKDCGGKSIVKTGCNKNGVKVSEEGLV